jgi:hypothetical protein
VIERATPKIISIPTNRHSRTGEAVILLSIDLMHLKLRQHRVDEMIINNRKVWHFSEIKVQFRCRWMVAVAMLVQLMLLPVDLTAIIHV